MSSVERLRHVQEQCQRFHVPPGPFSPDAEGLIQILADQVAELAAVVEGLILEQQAPQPGLGPQEFIPHDAGTPHPDQISGSVPDNPLTARPPDESREI